MQTCTMSLSLKIMLLTTLAMVAFAANSVLARMALQGSDIGPWSFTSIRLVSGALILVLVTGWLKNRTAGSWRSACALLAYAGFFSLAYQSLPAGVGALILFTVVQLTMIGSGLLNGERMSGLGMLGTVLAFMGLIVLLNPGLNAPNVFGAILMAASGLGWGLYSLRGRKASNATSETSGNFARAALLAAVLALPVLFLLPEQKPAPFGIALALASGVITSGLGYVIWYMALAHLSAIRAGIAQLTVPAIAAAGGILFLGEGLSTRFVIASLVILFGVGLATLLPRKT